LQDQVQEIAADAKAREARHFAAMDDFKSQHAVESHRSRHVVRRQGDRADARDHRQTPFLARSALLDPARCARLIP
jgi:hypothetical protein